jgi:6-pyruvoyltetrahydropterin/6-carboxytetrahydropterin synthase
MTMHNYKEFTIEVAHRLPNAPLGHKCGRLHGHSMRIEVHVTGAVDQDRGWVIDYGDIKKAFLPLHEALDHRLLNDIEGLGNPTSENLCRWIWSRLEQTLPGLMQVVVHETCTTGCIYEGDVSSLERSKL